MLCCCKKERILRDTHVNNKGLCGGYDGLVGRKFHISISSDTGYRGMLIVCAMVKQGEMLHVIVVSNSDHLSPIMAII